MGQIFVAILVGEICCKEGTAMAMKRVSNFGDEVTEGGAMLGWMRNGLNAVVHPRGCIMNS